MSIQPLVSVLMTAYNREKYIAEAIESVLVSTYNNFELIIVDDCSKDNTVLIAKSFAAIDARVKMFFNNKNLGDYPNRNRAASLAMGKYIKYVDSDDRIHPTGLQMMVESMEQFPTAGFGLCAIKPDDSRSFPFLLSSKEAYEYHFFGPGLFHKGPLTAIFVTTVFKSVGGFKLQRMISDIDMWHRMALQYPVVVMPMGLVYQRIHLEQELSDQKKFIVAGEKIKWKYLLNPLCELSPTQIKKIKQRRLKRYAGFVLSGLRHFNFEQAYIYQKCFWNTLKIKI